jgi:ureidoglycolate lyase
MQNNKPIVPKILTRENFIQFGDVIEVNDNAKNFSINDGFTQRYHDLAQVDVTLD